MSTPRQIAESYWKAECERDTAKVLSHYNEDATFCPPGQCLNGHAEIATFMMRPEKIFRVSKLKSLMNSPLATKLLWNGTQL